MIRIPSTTCTARWATPAWPFRRWAWHRQVRPRPGVKYPSGFHHPDDREAADLLALARDLGINLIDTARPTAAARNASARCCAASANIG